MVTFLAKMSVDMSDLFALGELGDWDNVQAPNTRVAVSKFVATLKSDQDIQYKFIGKNLSLVGEVPSGGTVKKIVVLDDKQQDYQVAGLSITFLRNKIQDTFDDNFEKSLFNGNDSITGSGDVDILIGYKGKDKVKGKGADDAILGKKGADKLKGNGGDDSITGNKGNDVLDGGPGNDQLTGNGGQNKFVFDAALGATNVDTVTDLTLGKDIMKLDSTVFIGIGPDGTLAKDKFVELPNSSYPEDVIIYDQSTGELSYEADGSGGADPILFARVTPGLDLRAEDFVVFS